MTLVEIIVVITIIAIIAATVGQRLLTQPDKARVKQAANQIAILKGALNMYYLDTGDLPTTQQGLKALGSNPGVEGWDGPYLDSTEVPTDPWNNPYAYQVPGTGRDYDIISYGKDGTPGGDGFNADISN